MNYLPRPVITKTLYLSFAFLLVTACASGPEKQNPDITNNAYKNLTTGVSHYNKSKYSQAQNNFKAALNLFRSIDHREGVASSCLNIAKIHLENNEMSLAKNYLIIAEDLITDSNISSLKDHLVITQSSLAIANKEFILAKNLLDPLVNSEQKNTIRLAAIQNRIRIAFEEDDINSAKKFTQLFSTALTNHKSSSYQARLHRFQAKLETDKAQAEKNYQHSLSIYRKHAHKPGIASTLHEWGDLLIKENDLNSAEDKLLRALFVRQSMEDEDGSIRLLISLNTLYKNQENTRGSNKAIRWVNKLSSGSFNQWARFIKAFNNYPAI